jgi:hypothetical protein
VVDNRDLSRSGGQGAWKEGVRAMATKKPRKDEIEVIGPGASEVEKSKNKVGQPLKFKSVEELQTKIDDYFDYCDNRIVNVLDKKGEVQKVKQPRPYTLAGLAYYLDTDRKTLLNYSYRDEYFPAIARARRKCESYANEQLFEGNDRGAKFSLMNNHEGYSDKQETVVSGPNGAPLQVQAVPFTYADFANLSEPDRQKLIEAARIMESLKNG